MDEPPLYQQDEGQFEQSSERPRMHLFLKLVLTVGMLAVLSELSMMESNVALRRAKIRYSRSTSKIEDIERLTEKETQSSPPAKIKLIHVLSPFVIKDQTSNYYPLDQEQWATMASIERARQYVPDQFELDFVCAMTEFDQQALSDLPCRQVLLSRSTKTEYPNIAPQKEIPFIQDILDASIEGHNLESDDFWLMLTNSDIGLTKHFYEILPKYMENRTAFTINRVTIPNENLAHVTSKQEILDQVDSLIHSGKRHAGTDCFLVHSSVLRRINFRDLFLGHPPWASNAHRILTLMSDNYIQIQSNAHGTFHLGNPKAWRSTEKVLPPEYADAESLDAYQRCPTRRKPNTEHGLQNTINCGKLFRSNRFVEDGNNQSVPIPAFVQDGYEELFVALQREQSEQTRIGREKKKQDITERENKQAEKRSSRTTNKTKHTGDLTEKNKPPRSAKQAEEKEALKLEQREQTRMRTKDRKKQENMERRKKRKQEERRKKNDDDHQYSSRLV